MNKNTPIHLQTKANRARWQEERVWANKLALRDRMELKRDSTRREFLPVKPIWGNSTKTEPPGASVDLEH